MHALALIVALALGAEGAPVNVWTGTDPSGSCKGSRVVVTTAGKVFACSSGTWAQRVTSGGVAGNPSLNGALYALGSTMTPGLYATGTTALAVNGSGTGVAATFSRASVATMTDQPGASGATWYRTATTGQLRVSGQWAGALIEPGATNLLATPTDSPSSSGNWSLIAAGPTFTAAADTFADGTSTATSVLEASGVVTGIQQTVSLTAQAYTLSSFFRSSSPYRQCWGMAIDGVVLAKFDVVSGATTWTASGVIAGVAEHSGLWTRPWVRFTPTAGSRVIQFFATAACADSTMAATGGTLTSYISHAQLEAGFLTSYTPTGTVRAADVLSFPVTLTGTSNCVSGKFTPYGAGWDARGTSALMGAFASGSSFGSANSMYIFDQGAGNVGCWVYDSSAAYKSVTIARSQTANGSTHVVKCCVSSGGTVTLGFDGGVTSVSAGAGTGIMSESLATVVVGSGSGTGFNGAPVAVSDVVACSQSDPNLCGDWSIPAQSYHGAVGDSITVGVQGLMNQQGWPNSAGTAAGVSIGTVAHGGWTTTNVLAALQAEPIKRWRKVAIAIGTNDLQPWAAAVERIRQIAMLLQGRGQTPILMTIIPRSLSGATETDRLNANASILNLCTTYGWTCADTATFMDDATYGGTAGRIRQTGVNWAADTTHPNTAGETAMGGFMATYFQ